MTCGSGLGTIRDRASTLAPFEPKLLKHVHDEFPELFEAIETTGEISDETADSLRRVIGDFLAQHLQSEEGAAA